jgi:AcrR family transcriptional regulator
MARTTRTPARPRRRLLPRAERRDGILRAAARAFARAGYASTSMDDVATAAGITRLIVYRHFATKEALYRAVLHATFDRVAAAFRDGSDTGGYGVGARTLLAAARADDAGFRLLWRHACREARFARYADTLRRQAVAAARSALADRVPAENLEWAAHAVVGYLLEAVLTWLEFGDSARDERFAVATNQALRAGVRAWAPSGRDEDRRKRASR